MPTALTTRFSRRLRAYPWRRVGVLAGVSLGLALLLVGYVFGFGNHFFGRLVGAFFIFFWLLAVTFLAVVPFVEWATANWFGQRWAAAPKPAPRPSRPAAPAARTRPH